jgi:hypothetical protein
VVAPSVLHGYVVNLQVLKVSLTVDVGVVWYRKREDLRITSLCGFNAW